MKSLNGFSGLHGGLATALLLRHMRAHVPPDRQLVSLSARFLRPLGSPISISSELVRNGSTATLTQGAAVSEGKVGVDAHAVFGGRSGGFREFATELPVSITSRDESEVFVVPPEFVPISQRMEVRPATSELPYSGAKDPVLCAWIHLREEVVSADERLLILVDALAPSYAAVLGELHMVPTVEMSVQLSVAAYRTDFDWVLVRAETTGADGGGWVRELVDVWSEDGSHLASCSQLRVVR
ncbi:acyl-CoA thioesterase [Nocardia sp.]|uniref:acyl-CoA thioesterase n=1 Tax=Nocardia sp. TaxID=1821 RepID=UPI0026219567|nr:thioesterase family protein [Nocardia sp.]